MPFQKPRGENTSKSVMVSCATENSQKIRIQNYPLDMVGRGGGDSQSEH